MQWQQYATSDGVDIEYFTLGTPSGRHLVFLHELGLDHRYWGDLAAALSPSLRISLVHLRGHGRSGFGAAGGLGQYVADIIDMLDGPTVLIGHGMGGMIAQGVAAERPDLIEALILEGTAVKQETEDRWEARAVQVLTQGIEDEHIRLATGFHHKAPDDLRTRVLAPLEHMVPEYYAAACRAIGHTDMLESTSRLTLPSLVLSGQADRIVPPDLSGELVALIPSAKRALIRNAGHFASAEAPGDVAQQIEQFLEAVPSDATVQPPRLI